MKQYYGSDDKYTWHDKVFKRAERLLKEATKKMGEAEGEEYLKTFMPQLHYNWEGYEALADVLNQPMQERYKLVDPAVQRRLEPDEDRELINQALADFHKEMTCARPPSPPHGTSRSFSFSHGPPNAPREFTKKNPERGAAWLELFQEKMIALLTHDHVPAVKSASPMKGPADLQKEVLLEQAGLAAKVAVETEEDKKVVSKHATPARNELLDALTNSITDDDCMRWSDVSALFPKAEAILTEGGPGSFPRWNFRPDGLLPRWMLPARPAMC